MLHHFSSIHPTPSLAPDYITAECSQEHQTRYSFAFPIALPDSLPRDYKVRYLLQSVLSTISMSMLIVS